MKIVQINSTCGVGSTGKICVQVSEKLDESGIENYIFYFGSGDGSKNAFKFATKSYVKRQALKSRVFANWGFNSKKATKELIKKLQAINPDIVHIHNIHSHDCNLELLFNYFKKVNQKIFWTFHDCWAFTGYCMYFTESGCDKWKYGCKNCPQKKSYSFFFDRSNEIFNYKKELFKDLDLTIIAPSKWMADLVRQSFLKDYPIKVINNGIDSSVFKPTTSDFRERYNISKDKKILLGVAFSWEERKGLSDFYELAKRLDKEKYQIVLVGANIKKKGDFLKKVITIERTNNQKELAEIYSASDLFINPTKEENFPTVNMESLACGTPIITYNTGGSPEVIDEKSGIVVEKGDIEGLYNAIIKCFDDLVFDREYCAQRARKFSYIDCIEKYKKLYLENFVERKIKVAQLNTNCGIGSTGKICASVSDVLDKKGIENYILYSYNTNGRANAIQISNKKEVKFAAARARILGNWGFNAKKATKKAIKELDKINPDIVHIHNIHTHDYDLNLLFNYLKERKQKLFWTFHDCWAFTGYCMHFVLAGCDKWKSGCQNCPQKKNYSLLLDKSKKLFNYKKELFKDLDLTIITPSKWLANLTKQSFLKDYPIKVINNGIDLSVFKPQENNFRQKYNIEKHKKIILGVSFGWGYSKGLDVFCDLANRLDSKKYQIVLVGTNDQTDRILPKNIISIHRTNNQQELVEIYTAADLFVNPTREDNFPTVNMESLACGTPVLTFKTGGSPEIIDDKSGRVTLQNTSDSMYANIIDICENNLFTVENCCVRAKSFDMYDKFKEYSELYEVQ